MYECLLRCPEVAYAKTQNVACRRGFCCSCLLTGDVIRGQEPDWNDLAKKIHSLARPGSTPERRAAWEKLPKAEQEEMVTEFHERLTEALQAAKTDQRAPWLPVDKPVRHRYIEPGFRTLAMFDEIDSDGDGLSDLLEEEIAFAFVPEYHISSYEQAEFVTLQPWSQQMQVQTTVDPGTHVYYRVTPYGHANGKAYLRLDYLTVWDRDDGLVIDGLCLAWTYGLGIALDGLASHDWDTERSVILVACSPVNGWYSREIGDYRAYKIYTAAHEGATTSDHSMSTDLDAAPHEHVLLWLSLSKHATYWFNPEGYPLIPWYVMTAFYADVELGLMLDLESCDYCYYDPYCELPHCYPYCDYYDRYWEWQICCYDWALRLILRLQIHT